jgi:hypothetical protein
MNNRLREDIHNYPELFWFKEPLGESDIRRTFDLWQPPNDLLEFWREFGSGDMFESETILRPFAASSSVEFITERERRKGFPMHLTVFHLGIFISGFNSEGFEAFERDSFSFLGRFKTLDDWYVNMIRGSFEKRYRL